MMNKMLSPKKMFRGFLTNFLLPFAAALLLSLLVMNFFRLIVVSGSSMEPTYYDGDIVVYRKNSDFTYGDVVVFEHDGKLLIKRVIAMSGQTVALSPFTGATFVDGAVIRDEFTAAFDPALLDAWPGAAAGIQTVVPEACVFLMGDNRPDSLDSRSQEIGMVEKSKILGRVVFPNN